MKTTMESGTDWYEPTYECILPHKPEQTAITCFRMVKNYLSNFKQHSNSYSGSKYQNFKVDLENSDCSMSCINIVWRNGWPDKDDFTGDILQDGNECLAQNQESSSSGLGVGLGITLPLVFILASVVGVFLWKRKMRQPSQPEALQKSDDIQGKSCQNSDDTGLGEGRCSYVDMAAPPARGAALAVIEESDVYEAVRPTSEFVYTSLMDSEDTQAEYGNMNEVLRENSDSEDMSATYDNFGVWFFLMYPIVCWNAKKRIFFFLPEIANVLSIKTLWIKCNNAIQTGSFITCRRYKLRHEWNEITTFSSNFVYSIIITLWISSSCRLRVLIVVFLNIINIDNNFRANDKTWPNYFYRHSNCNILALSYLWI